MSSSLNHRRGGGEPESAVYTSKPQKQWSVSRSVEYVLREQRFMFVLVGMAIASVFFLFLRPEFQFTRAHSEASTTFPGVVGYESVEETLGSVRAFESAPYRNQHSAIVSPGGKIPLGLPRKGLRVVVTGGAGFVGSHLVDKLIARGDSVIVVDNFFTGRKENVMHHFGNPRFELIRHDVVEPLLLEVDHIYHLACPASPVHYKFNPIKTIISSLRG